MQDKPHMMKKEMISRYRKQFEGEPRYLLARNACSRTKIGDSALNWERFREINHTFSHRVSNELKVTSQKQSGRCWLFAALNLLRLKVAGRYKLEEFELSQSYLFFWDKFEKANYFLENILQTLNEPVDSRIVMHLLSNPLEDGGQWHMFVSLVDKYGLVPQKVYPDSMACAASSELNRIAIEKLREFGCILRKNAKKKSSELQKMKEEMMGEIYRILAIHLGPPPEKFDWEFHDKNKKFHTFRGLTPKKFFQDHVKVDLDDYVCLIHSPRKTTPYHKTFTIDYLGNVVEGKQIVYLNVPIDEMKKACVKTLKDGEPVWFGCDVGKYLHRDLGIMDVQLFDDELLYDTKFHMTKEDRMNHCASQMTHAMLFTGVHLVDDKPKRYRVENSWDKNCGEKGYFIMDDDWYDEYMFECAIEKKRLPKKLVEEAKQKPIHLPPWDPCGSLAN